ncbi:hypothetical protein TrVE_jg2967 [Triparma verrucosa]|uniref:Uncharacterized protein n=1 Tax=Triparma verrucosa TaxID=1606542 RepID=A0A9W7FFK7_9STRA|nr:hypothetical protein TrVE_jg2967 [Triparma verrucosa]
MKITFFSALALTQANANNSPDLHDVPITKRMLDAMEKNSTGSDFSSLKWLEYEACMAMVSAEFDFDLLESTDALFSGFLQWGRTNGTGVTEPPQPTEDGADQWDQPQNYLEHFPSHVAPNDDNLPGASETLVVQPCNYNSNVAYYESARSLCNSARYRDFSMPSSTVLLLAASFTSLGTGSAFFHGSGTQLGNRIDNAPIGQIALTAHQVAVSSLRSNDVVASCRSQEDIDEKVTQNGTDVIARFNHIFADNDITAWDQAILDLGETFQSDYKVTFSCIVTTIARIVLPERVGTVLLKFLCTVFGFEQDKIDFLFNEFDAQLQTLLVEKTEEIGEISGDDKKLLLKHGLGVLLKIGYAMFWQEELFVGPWLTSTHANEIGAFLQPFVNVLADKMTGYEHPPMVRTGHDIYPNCKVCRRQEPHSKWHEQSSVGMIDLVYLTDDVDILLRSGKLGPASTFTAEDLLTDQIESFLDTDEATCLVNGAALGISCIAELWFGKDAFQEFKCDSSNTPPASCLKDHIASHSTPTSQIISMCVQKNNPASSDEIWDAEIFSSCMVDALPTSKGDFWRFLQFALK